MAGFPVGGPSGLKPAEASALMRNLRSSAPPMNPQTPKMRQDTTADRYRALKQVEVSCQKLLLHIDDAEPALKMLVTGMQDVCNKILAGVDPQQVMAGLAASLGGANAPAPPPPMMGGAPGVSAGAAPAPGMPGMGAPPVSPGPVPG